MVESGLEITQNQVKHLDIYDSRFFPPGFKKNRSHYVALAGLELLLLLLCQRRVLSFLGWPGALSPTGSIGTPKIPKLALVGVF